MALASGSFPHEGALECGGLVAGLGCVHQLARIERDIALRESASDKKVVREIWKIVHARLHIRIVNGWDWCGYILGQTRTLQRSEPCLERDGNQSRRLTVRPAFQAIFGVLSNQLPETVFGFAGYRNERILGVDQRAHCSSGAALATHAIELAVYRDSVGYRLLGGAVIPVHDHLDGFDLWLLVEDFAQPFMALEINRIAGDAA